MHALGLHWPDWAAAGKLQRRSSMNKAMMLMFAAGGTMLLAACQVPEGEIRPPQRTMGLRLGPELVFKRPIEEVVPELAGATATGNNGRVGSELAFWSYRLADGRNVLLHACAEFPGVDCLARSHLICPAGRPQAIMDNTAQGDVRRLECRIIGAAAPGDLRPNCSDFEFEHPIKLGLASCP
jgi:hypothetical protein